MRNKKRICEYCGGKITHRPLHARYCKPCSIIVRTISIRKAVNKWNKKKKAKLK